MLWFGSTAITRATAGASARAKRPVFYTGGGVVNSGPHAAQLLRELARLTGYPVTGFVTMLCALVIYDSAYLGEIIRAGIEAVSRGQLEAGASLAMSRLQVFRHIVLRPALQKIWPALTSQLVIVMFGSAVCSQIAVEELTYAANFIQSRNFRAFEVYFVATGVYLLLAIVLRQAMRGLGAWFVFGRRAP